MTRRSTALALLFAAPLAAALFGAAQAQLSYSVGASFFHEARFDALGLGAGLRNRAGAALAGMAGAWWLGLVLAVPLIAACWLWLRKGSTLLAVGGGLIALALILALCGAMAGLLLGMLAPEYAASLPLPEGLDDTEGYLRAALMHEGAGLAATLILPIGVWIIRRARQHETGTTHRNRRTRAPSSRAAASDPPCPVQPQDRA